MKRSLVLLTILGASLLLAPAARADYALSISYGYPNLHKTHGACTFNPGRGITCGSSRRVVRYPHPRQYKHWNKRRKHKNKTRVVYMNTGTWGRTIPQETRVETREKVGISDIIILSKAGVSEAVIIEKIARTGSVFDLSVQEVEALRREGVSRRVINYMLDTAR